jgi:hypothetical protein
MMEDAAGYVIAHGGEPPQANAFFRAVIEFARDKILEHADRSMTAQANLIQSDVLALLR